MNPERVVISLRRALIISTVISLLLMLTQCSRFRGRDAAHFLTDGKRLLQNGDYYRAVLEFKNAEKLQPKSAEPQYQMALVYLKLGDLQSALFRLKNAIALDPKRSDARVILIDLLARSGQRELTEEAKRQADYLVMSSPEDPDALASLALTEAELGDPGTAITRLRKILEKFPGNMKAASTLALLRVANHDMQGAEAILKEAVAQSPKLAEPRLALAHFYQVVGKEASAGEQFSRVVKDNPNHPLALSSLAQFYASAGRNGDAELIYRRLTTLPDKSYGLLYGQFLLVEGKYAAAADEFIGRLKTQPGNWSARNGLVSAYLQSGRVADAAKLVKAALKSNPKDMNALVQQAQIAVRTRDYQAAETALNNALRFDNTLPDVHYVLGLLREKEGQLHSAQAEFIATLEHEPRMLGARIELCKLLIKRRQANLAVQYADQAPENQKTLLPLIVIRNWALIAVGKLPEAQLAVENALKNRQNPALLLQRAVLWNSSGQYQRGIDSIEQALKLDPNSEDGIALLMRTYVAAKNPDEGIRRIRASAVANPNSPMIQFLLGQQLVALSRREEARAALGAAWESDHRFHAAPLTLARLDLEDGNLDSARNWVASLLKQDNANPQALFIMGRVEEQKSNLAEATAYYRRAVELNPSFVVALNNLAYVLAEQNKELNQALAYAQKAYELDPNDIGVADTLGWCYYRKGLYDDAIYYLRRFATPGASAVRKLHLAMAYVGKGDRSAARSLILDLRQHHPDLPELRLISDE